MLCSFCGVAEHKNAVGHHKNERYGLKNVCAHQKRTITVPKKRLRAEEGRTIRGSKHEQTTRKRHAEKATKTNLKHDSPQTESDRGRFLLKN